MFLILLDYRQPLAVIDLHVAAHREHLAAQYAKGSLLLSGPQVPRNGGVILACLQTREEVDAMMQADPFVINAVAEYRVVEFLARATHADLAAFAEALPA